MSDKLEQLAKDAVAQYWKRMGFSDPDEDETTHPPIKLVWFSKTLQNWKAMLIFEGMKGVYFEVTHDGSRNRSYVDVYQKIKNYSLTQDSSI